MFEIRPVPWQKAQRREEGSVTKAELESRTGQERAPEKGFAKGVEKEAKLCEPSEHSRPICRSSQNRRQTG